MLLDPPEQHENEKNNEYRADNADTSMAEAVTVASEAATETTKQQDNKKNNEDGTKRHADAPVEPSNVAGVEGYGISLKITQGRDRRFSPNSFCEDLIAKVNVVD